MQYNHYLWLNCRKCCVLQETGVKEHEDDVKCQTRSRNMFFLHMRNKNYALLVDEWLEFLHPVAFLLTTNNFELWT